MYIVKKISKSGVKEINHALNFDTAKSRYDIEKYKLVSGDQLYLIDVTEAKQIEIESTTSGFTDSCYTSNAGCV